MLVEVILVHGDICYKFCWLLLSEDRNQGTPVDWAPINSIYTNWARKSNGTTSREGANFTVILSFQSACDFHHKFGDFHHKFGDFFFILLTLLIVSSTCSYFNISFSLMLVNLSLFIVLFPFVFFCFCFCYSWY